MAKKKRSNRIIYILIITVVVVIVFGVIGKKAGWIGKEPELKVEIAKAQKNDIIEKVSATGMVQPVTEVKLSPDVPGEIIELNIEEGDSVKKGDMLVKIKPDNFVSALNRSVAMLNQQKANYHSSLATLEKAKANLTLTESDYERQKKLYDQQVISEAEWQKAKQAYEVAVNDLTSAEQAVKAAEYIIKSSEASVSEARENVMLTNVKAPMNGTVSKLSVELGERVVGTQQMAGTEMLRIADLNNMEVRVDVNENDIIRVSLGDTAIIDVDSYSYMDKEFRGVVTQIANTANEKVSSDAVTEFEVRILILNESYQDLVAEGRKYPFRPGMTASVEIITDRKAGVLSIPLGAVTTRNIQELDTTQTESEVVEVADVSTEEALKEDEIVAVVFVKKEGKAEIREVKTGISDYDHIEILEGIKEGEEIISGPFLVVSKRLKNGTSITTEENP